MAKVRDYHLNKQELKAIEAAIRAINGQKFDKDAQSFVSSI